MSNYEPLPSRATRMAEPYSGKSNRAKINEVFRAHDDSHLWPINGKFNATERAIRRIRRFMRESGHDLQGLEYAMALDEEIIDIVNDPKHT